MELSVGKIILILLVVVLVFGTAKLPKMGEDLGKAIRSFKKASQEEGLPEADKPQSKTEIGSLNK
ncbi:MAG: twin-arginine translocase TatA/TatE family subunit [Gammaproteobacteria bacterium]